MTVQFVGVTNLHTRLRRLLVYLHRFSACVQPRENTRHTWVMACAVQSRLPGYRTFFCNTVITGIISDTGRQSTSQLPSQAKQNSGQVPTLRECVLNLGHIWPSVYIGQVITTIALFWRPWAELQIDRQRYIMRLIINSRCMQPQHSAAAASASLLRC